MQWHIECFYDRRQLTEIQRTAKGTRYSISYNFLLTSLSDFLIRASLLCCSLVFLGRRTEVIASGSPAQYRSSTEDKLDTEPPCSQELNSRDRKRAATACADVSFRACKLPVFVSIWRSSNSCETLLPLNLAAMSRAVKQTKEKIWLIKENEKLQEYNTWLQTLIDYPAR